MSVSGADERELEANNVMDSSPARHVTERSEPAEQRVQRQREAARREQAKVDRERAASERELARQEVESGLRAPTSERKSYGG